MSTTFHLLALPIFVGLLGFAMDGVFLRRRLRSILRADTLCLDCGLPQIPTEHNTCPSCSTPGRSAPVGRWFYL